MKDILRTGITQGSVADKLVRAGEEASMVSIDDVASAGLSSSSGDMLGAGSTDIAACLFFPLLCGTESCKGILRVSAAAPTALGTPNAIAIWESIATVLSGALQVTMYGQSKPRDDYGQQVLAAASARKPAGEGSATGLDLVRSEEMRQNGASGRLENEARIENSKARQGCWRLQDSPPAHVQHFTLCSCSGIRQISDCMLPGSEDYWRHCRHVFCGAGEQQFGPSLRRGMVPRKSTSLQILPAFEKLYLSAQLKYGQ